MHLEGTEGPHFYEHNIYGPVTDPPLNSSAPHLPSSLYNYDYPTTIRTMWT